MVLPHAPALSLLSALLGLLAAVGAVQAATVVSVAADGRVSLAGVGDIAAGTVLELRRGDDLLGFLEATKTKAGTSIRVIAGRAEAGAQAIAIERPRIRVGFLGGPEGERVSKELAVLCPGRVVSLGGEAELDAAKLDAVVITASAPEPQVRRFVEGGGTAIVDLAVYAAWAGGEARQITATERPVVEVVAASDATRGLAVGQAFTHFGRQATRPVCRCLDKARGGGQVLLALRPGKQPVAVEHRIGKGRLLALDLLAPNGEPGYDAGSVLKWVLPGNLLARSVRYTRALSYRLKTHDEYMKLQEAVAERVKGTWVREQVGVDSGGKPIWRFRMGSLDRPSFLLDGAIHAGEWLNPYLLLDLIDYLAHVPEADYRTRWLLRHYTVLVIPMLSGSMRQESFNGCDLNRNFDFRWDDYTRGYGWRKGRALKLRGAAPFSEPEARVVRDHIWNHPVVGYVNTHMHGLQHGAMFIAPHKLAAPRRRAFDAAAKIMAAHLRDRFLWKGPRQLVFRRSAHDGRTVPFAGNWAGYQGLWAVTTELAGGSDHSLHNKEVAFEGILAFLHAVGAEFAAGKRPWLGCPRTGFARPGGHKDATALVFTRGGKQTIAYRTNRGGGTLRLALPPEGCRLADEAGKPVAWQPGGDHCLLPMDTRRRFFLCGAATRQQVLDALKRATSIDDR